MYEPDLLAHGFQEHRGRLRAVAYRMLGSLSEADDAVQETWLRLARTDTRKVETPAAWLTTVVARVCLNMLRARETRREEPLEGRAGAEPASDERQGADPEEEAMLADSVGLALLVVLDRLSPAERVAFVLHDMFAVSFDEIGVLLERSPAAARQLASRARRRVRGGGSPAPAADVARRRQIVEAFLTASRGGDFDALLALLAPDVVLHADAAVGPTRAPITVSGAGRVTRGASAAAERARYAQTALIDGTVGLVMATRGRLSLVLRFTVSGDAITEIDVVADPARLRALRIDLLEAA